MTELELILQKLQIAKYPEDIFTLSGYRSQFRTLTKMVHPDILKGNSEPFRILLRFYELAKQKINNGTFGKKFIEFEIKSKIQTYRIIDRIADGTLSDVYKSVDNFVVKISKHASCNDLLKKEADTIIKIYPPSEKEEKFNKYFPKLHESFILKNSKGQFVVNVFNNTADERISLLKLKEAFPEGVAGEHVAWIFKRMLAAVGFVHEKGYFYGGCTPDHIFVHPTEHGAKLVDWCWSEKLGTVVQTISAKYKDFYPSEIINKLSVSSGSDIYMIAKTIMYIAPENLHTKILNFFKSCLVANPKYRPSSAWDLHKEFDDLLLSIFGKPKYVPLNLNRK